jgi:hypothetical protein
VSLDSSYDSPSSSRDTATIYKIGPTIVVGSAKTQGSKAKPVSRVRATQSNQREEPSDTKCGQQLVHSVPHRGDLASSSFVFESRPGGFLHAPLCGLAPSRLGFPAREYPRKMLQTTWSELDQGSLANVWSYGEALALAGSHP